MSDPSFLRLRQVALVAHDRDAVVDDLKAIFGVEVAFNDPDVGTFGLHNAVIPVGRQFIEVVAPIRENTAGGRYLERRKGDGGYMVILQCDTHPPRKARATELEIRSVLDHDDGKYVIMQLHPADTGGVFLEIDEQRGGESFDGPWMPAGPNWQKAITDRVDGIAAVDIETPDVARLSTRWSDILEIPVAGDAIELTNATIRFVPMADDRGEGLLAVDVITANAEAVRAAAEQRGRLDGDDIVVCGVRFRLVAPV